MLISELATATNETTKTLRFYETAGVLPEPPRTSGSYRDYPHTAIARVRFIRSLQGADLSLDEIATVLDIVDSTRSPGSTDLALIESTLVRIDTHLDTLTSTRREFAELLDPTTATTPDATP